MVEMLDTRATGDSIHRSPSRNWKWCIDNTNSGAAERSDAHSRQRANLPQQVVPARLRAGEVEDSDRRLGQQGWAWLREVSANSFHPEQGAHYQTYERCDYLK